LYDGEGCTSMANTNRSLGSQSLQIDIGQSGNDNIPEVLQRFQGIMEVGKIYGPYAPTKHSTRKNHYCYRATGPNAILVLTRMWPYLCSTKRAQALAAEDKYVRLDLRDRLPKEVNPYVLRLSREVLV
jgi:hypothetical protein